MPISTSIFTSFPSRVFSEIFLVRLRLRGHPAGSDRDLGPAVANRFRQPVLADYYIVMIRNDSQWLR
ncbi:hypothetical protein HMPREF0620_1259 [Parascardovia denticolens DSM 10105 = JCM 12538]|uniref:Uncharacterized protein n=1 Tax=Parascardovia denticolens DSM 10105 = JCM 12538 TaxID=864564 RepID=E6K2M0_PARDN|nr:hypothetical protein HMPREF0620_1259 [Parascardovia denticolens DSM 10105 = JCM 12538]